MYDRLKQLIKKKGMTVTGFEKMIGASRGSLVKIDTHKPNSEKMQKIADMLGVSVDYIMGNQSATACKDCGFYYDPLNDTHNKEHEKAHERWRAFREEYPEWTNYADASSKRDTAISKFRNRFLPDEERIEAFNLASRLGFLKDTVQNNYIEPMAYNDYLKREIDLLRPDGTVSSDLIQKIRSIYKYETYTFSNIMPLSTQSIPMLGSIACGEPIFMDSSPVDVYTKALCSIKADFCLVCKGSSMINAGIHDGDVVFIKKDVSFVNGKIYAVAIDNEATLKRIYRSADSVTLLSENPSYAPIVITENEAKNLRILGLAVAYQSDVV